MHMDCIFGVHPAVMSSIFKEKSSCCSQDLSMMTFAQIFWFNFLS